jgi:pSer/pThr/pTyr-binding forkhead associated (FHA) protein
MSTIPRLRDITAIEQCSADRFDEEYLRIIKGQGFKSGYFTFPDGPVNRYLLIDEGEPLTAAWDDGVDGRTTSINEFFTPFLKGPQNLTFCQGDPQLINSLAVSWQQRPDAHTSPGLIDAAEMIKSLLRRTRDFIVRLRRDAHTSVLILGQGKIHYFYMDTQRHTEGAAETRLVHELTANHAFLTIDVFETQEANRAEDWALVPSDFTEGMIKFYCCSSPHLFLLLGDREVKRVPLLGKITIGREPANELFIDNLSVSRRHAEAIFKHGECRITDLGSKNGTMFKNQRLEMTMLDRTMVLKPAAFPGAAQKEEQKLAILTVNGRVHPVRNSPFLIGGAEEMNLVLGGPGIKGVHAAMEKDASGQWWISHRGGILTTTRINGHKVKTSPLRSGDLIQLGMVMLRFQLTEESAG